MASTINAQSTGAGGLVYSGDSSGQLALQANGSTIATVSSTGLAVTGTITTGGVVGSPYSMKNRIINSTMAISQRGSVNVVSGGSYTYTASDRFSVGNYFGSGQINTAISTSVVPSGYNSSLGLTVSTAPPLSGSTGYFVNLAQTIFLRDKKKIILLFVKLLIGAACFTFIYLKLRGDFTQEKLEFILRNASSVNGILCFSLCFFLIPINWGIESYKWMLITLPVEKINYLTATKSQYSGVCLGNLAPGRATEFIGKIFFYHN